MKLHVSGEDYLEAILVLQKKSGMVRSIDLARHMGFSKPSISHAVGVLKKEGLRNKRSSRGEQNRKKKQETRDNLAKEEILKDDRFFFIAGYTS